MGYSLYRKVEDHKMLNKSLLVRLAWYCMKSGVNRAQSFSVSRSLVIEDVFGGGGSSSPVCFCAVIRAGL